ncbi:MAG TPA: hypothetical protein PLI43_03370 [Albidovulum sp.]|uniref:hypothetical protein n=1 Tax=Albidovulum sp. TaxID=1872424 RepID=UPI002C7528BF|nr:hypothetical protein [Albidovulum sp.]
MLKPVLAFLLLVVALCAAGSPAVSVTMPWAQEEETSASRLAVDLGAVSRAVALASAEGFKGLRTGRQETARSKFVALLRAGLQKVPWLGDGRAMGLWTWQRNPALGVAVYGPGIGGYSSFSWTRQRGPDAGLVAAAKLRPLTQQELLLQRNGRGGGPVPVPLPPAAPMLLAAIGITALLRRRSGSVGKGASHPT